MVDTEAEVAGAMGVMVAPKVVMDRRGQVLMAVGMEKGAMVGKATVKVIMGVMKVMVGTRGMGIATNPTHARPHIQHLRRSRVPQRTRSPRAHHRRRPPLHHL